MMPFLDLRSVLCPLRFLPEIRVTAIERDIAQPTSTTTFPRSVPAPWVVFSSKSR